MNWYDILHTPCLWITSLYVIFIPILVYNHAGPLALSSPQFSLPIHFMHILKIMTHIYHTYLFNKAFIGASLVSQRLKRLPVMQKTWVGKIPWRRKWQPTPVFLPGKSHGQRSLEGYSPQGHKRVGHDWATSLSLSFSLIHQTWNNLKLTVIDIIPAVMSQFLTRLPPPCPRLLQHSKLHSSHYISWF